MLGDFGHVGFFLILAILFPVGALLFSYILSFVRVRPRPKEPNPAKTATYECGMETIGTSWIQFSPRYYLYALLFVVFDIETVFLYPWAVRFKQLELFGFIEMIVFIVILMVGFVYAWRKKALEWK